MKKPYLIGFVFLLLSSTACEKLLEIDQPNNQINTAGIFEDPTTAQAAMANLYANLSSAPYNFLAIDLSLYTDELDNYSLFSNEFYTNQLLPDLGSHLDYWIKTYKNLYAINACIEGLNSSKSLEPNLKNTYLGEAYFLRAYHHLILSQLYGAIPYVNSTDYRYNSSIKKTAHFEVLVLIEADLQKAHDLLTTTYRGSNRIYPNQSVVSLLLAQTYLLQNNYPKAIQYAQEVLQNTAYVLNTTNLNQVFTMGSTETLWQLKAPDNFPSNPLLRRFRFVRLPPPEIALSTSLLDQFETGDARLTHWTQTVTQGGESASYAFKYQSDVMNTGPIPIVYRLSEVYLTLAEALAYDNQIPEATTQLNRIRERAQLLPLPNTLSQTAFINELLAEYQREFFTEGGHRFFDLKRNNRLDDLRATKSSWTTRNALFPIPEKELIANPNLKPQNP